MGHVRNILQSKGHAIFSVEPTSTVYEALELMFDKNVGALLVTNFGKFVGIFTERDYARKVVLKGKSSKDTLVGEIMSFHPITVSEDFPIDDCMKLMAKKYIRHLPVIDGDRIVGLISIGDVVKFIMDEQLFIIENLEQYITH